MILFKGEFNLKIRDVQICKGPKRKDCSSMKIKIIDNGKKFWVDFELFENVVPDKVI